MFTGFVAIFIFPTVKDGIIAHNSYFIQVYRPADPPFKRSKNCRLYKIDSVSCDSGIFDCTIPDIT